MPITILDAPPKTVRKPGRITRPKPLTLPRKTKK